MQLLRGFKFYVLSVCVLLSACCLCYGQAVQKDDEGEVIIELKPGNKNALFKGDDVIDYKLKVKSTYKLTQSGKLTYEVLSDGYKKLSTTQLAVNLTQNSSETYSISIPKKEPGFYRVNFQLNLTTYDDTVRRVFGVDPEKIQSTLHKPADFDAFWKGTLDLLKKVPPQYKVTFRKDLSTNSKKVYAVEMHSYEDLLIRGWLVIPTYGKKLPVHYRVPGYVVELKPNMDNDDYIAFDINVRGNGNSRDVISVGTDTYCLIGLEDKNKYIYRGVYMDCIRGLDFLYASSKLGIDTSKIYVEGGSQGGALGVVLASLDKRVKVLSVQVPLYSDIHDALNITAGYDSQVFPFKMFRRYKNDHPGYTWDQFFNTWDYYDPQNFAPQVKCPVLMGIGLLDMFCPPRCSIAMYNHLGSASKEFVSVANSTHEVNFNYFMFQNLWIREKLRVP